VIYHVTLRDRETSTAVGYYNGTWTTDSRRALALLKREEAEAHAARIRDRSPRNADPSTSRRSLRPTGEDRWYHRRQD
jgi:hypothetical protein